MTQKTFLTGSDAVNFTNSIIALLQAHSVAEDDYTISTIETLIGNILASTAPPTAEVEKFKVVK